jgi:ubiquinone/menaquinone biosynthesis C-methylase UbiE
LEEKRYLTDALPVLPFPANQFDLALCSHFLFTYSDHFSAEFHIEAIAEMCRVAKEARIFPLLNISGEPSPLLHPVLSELQKQGYVVEIKQVPYEFQRGGNLLLRVCQAKRH